MPPSTKSEPARSSIPPCTAVREVVRAITLPLTVYLHRICATVADLGRCTPAEPGRRHVATLATLVARGWRVGEIRTNTNAPALWRVTAERYDGTVSITVADAADPDAALEELARYTAADAGEAR